MQSFLEIGSPVLEKIFCGEFLPYMGITVILVMWPGLFIKTLVPPSYKLHIKLTMTGPSGFREDL